MVTFGKIINYQIPSMAKMKKKPLFKLCSTHYFRVPDQPPSLIWLYICASVLFFNSLFTLQEAQLSCCIYIYTSHDWVIQKWKDETVIMKRVGENLDLRWRPRKATDWVCMEKKWDLWHLEELVQLSLTIL